MKRDSEKINFFLKLSYFAGCGIDKDHRLSCENCELNEVSSSVDQLFSLPFALRETIVLSQKKEELIIEPDTGALACVFNCHETVIVAFQGTRDNLQWLRNLDFRLVKEDGAGFHRGIHQSAVKMYDILRPRFQRAKRIYLTGYSLGASVAAYIHHFLVREGCQDKVETVICGSPRLGDQSFFDSFSPNNFTQVVHRTDPLTTIPPQTFGYVDTPAEFCTLTKAGPRIESGLGNACFVLLFLSALSLVGLFGYYVVSVCRRSRPKVNLFVLSLLLFPLLLNVVYRQNNQHHLAEYNY